MFSQSRISLPLRVWRTALVAVLAFSVGSASVALGLVVNGVVEACYNNATGVLRLATTTRPCMTHISSPALLETAISWNQVGPQGLKGDKGDQGIQGIPGPKGDKGDPGADGGTGSTTVQYITVQSESFARAFCPPGTKVTGGGAFIAGGSYTLGGSFPIADATGVTASGTTAVGWQAMSSDGIGLVSVTVICTAP